MKERTLIAFTILSQLAVGTFWILSGLRFSLADGDGLSSTAAALDRVFIVIPVVMILSITASFLHLGSPRNAWRAGFNVRTSWLSREILFALLFTLASLFYAVSQALDLGPLIYQNILVLVSAAFGLGLIVGMSQAYRLRTIPAWDTWQTPVTFFIATLLLGLLATSGGLVSMRGLIQTQKHTPFIAAYQELDWILLHRFGWASAFLACIELILFRLWLLELTSGSGAAAEAAARVTRAFRPVLLLRLALSFAGIIAITWFLLPFGDPTYKSLFFYSAFGLFLSAETLGRFLFYEAQVRVGV